MKKIFFSALCFVAFSALLIVSCKLKNNDKITPTYRNQSTGTGANPNMNVVTVTGEVPVSNPATQNSSLQVSTAGWNFDSYATHPTYFKAQNGTTTIMIQFSGNITAGTFNLTAGPPGAGQARIIVYNAPGQPAEITWYSKSGTVTVTGTIPNFNATFSNVPCVQLNYLFPVVTVSGSVIC
jgi:hypothetical protein